MWVVIDPVMRAVITETRVFNLAPCCEVILRCGFRPSRLGATVKLRRGFRPSRLGAAVMLRRGFRPLRLGAAVMAETRVSSFASLRCSDGYD